MKKLKIYKSAIALLMVSSIVLFIGRNKSETKNNEEPLVNTLMQLIISILFRYYTVLQMKNLMLNNLKKANNNKDLLNIK